LIRAEPRTGCATTVTHDSPTLGQGAVGTSDSDNLVFHLVRASLPLNLAEPPSATVAALLVTVIDIPISGNVVYGLWAPPAFVGQIWELSLCPLAKLVNVYGAPSKSRSISPWTRRRYRRPSTVRTR
jgi:hypothetical protein